MSNTYYCVWWHHKSNFDDTPSESLLGIHTDKKSADSQVKSIKDGLFGGNDVTYITTEQVNAAGAIV